MLPHNPDPNPTQPRPGMNDPVRAEPASALTRSAYLSDLQGGGPPSGGSTSGGPGGPSSSSVPMGGPGTVAFERAVQAKLAAMEVAMGLPQTPPRASERAPPPARDHEYERPRAADLRHDPASYGGAMRGGYGAAAGRDDDAAAFLRGGGGAGVLEGQQSGGWPSSQPPLTAAGPYGADLYAAAPGIPGIGPGSTSDPSGSGPGPGSRPGPGAASSGPESYGDYGSAAFAYGRPQPQAPSLAFQGGGGEGQQQYHHLPSAGGSSDVPHRSYVGAAAPGGAILPGHGHNPGHGSHVSHGQGYGHGHGRVQVPMSAEEERQAKNAQCVEREERESSADVVVQQREGGACSTGALVSMVTWSMCACPGVCVTCVQTVLCGGVRCNVCMCV